MPLTRRHVPLCAAAVFAAVSAAACSSGHGAGANDALRRDLEAAGGDGLALAPRGSQTQVVSALELANGKANRAGTPTPAAAGAHARANSAPQQVAAHAPVAAPRVVERVRIIERVIERDPAPTPAPARTEVAAAPATATPAAAPPAADPATVAAPSPGSRRLPQPTDVPPPSRARRRAWDMGDVIRNAPFPINP